jgi:hypothetical protein
MPVAPRYQPEGVRIGEMPVPTAKADMSGANAMAAIGDTFATLGKAADVYQHRQKMRQVYDDTVGEEAFKKWERDRESDYNTFKIEAQGSNVPDKRTWFDQQIKGDVSSYTKDLKPEQVAAFEKRRTFRADTFNQAANNHALIKSNEHVINVSTVEYQDSLSNAAAAKAGGDIKGYMMSIGRANDARSRRQVITGEKYDPVEDVYDANAGALKILSSNDDFEATTEFYEKNKGNFGKYEKNAAIMADNAVNEVWARSSAQVAITTSMQESGLVNWDQATSNLMEYDGINAARADKSMKRIAQARTAEDKRRKDVAESFNAAIDDTLLRGQNPLTLLQTDEAKKDLKYMEPTARNSILEKASKGRSFTDPASDAYMTSALKTANPTDIASAKEYLNKNIGMFTTADINNFNTQIIELGKREATNIEKAHDVVVQEIGRELHMPRPSKEHPTLNAREMEQWRVADELSSMTVQYLKDNKQEINETNVKHGYAVITAKLDRVKGGWLSGSVDELRAVDLGKSMPKFDAESDRAAGITAGDDFLKANLKREVYLRQQEAEKETAVQKAAEDAAAVKGSGYENIWDRPIFPESWSLPEGGNDPLTGSLELAEFKRRRSLRRSGATAVLSAEEEDMRSSYAWEQKRKADAAAAGR